jgi:hypothetical protein
VVPYVPNYATGGAVVLNYPVQEARLRQLLSAPGYWADGSSDLRFRHSFGTRALMPVLPTACATPARRWGWKPATE